MAESSESVVEGHSRHHNQVQPPVPLRSRFLRRVCRDPNAPKTVPLAADLVFRERGDSPPISRKRLELVHRIQGQHVHDGGLGLRRYLRTVDVRHEHLLTAGQGILHDCGGR